jgi:mannose-6-phosphate isomerase-like protein (cupin superfamily)
VTAEGRRVIGPEEGATVLEGGFGAVLKLAGTDTGGPFSVVEHPLAPGVLASPPHTHRNEDEYSFVVEGTVGVMVGGEVHEAGPGSYVTKPRGVPHVFWNAGPGPVRGTSRASPPRASSGTSRSSPGSFRREDRPTCPR